MAAILTDLVLTVTDDSGGTDGSNSTQTFLFRGIPNVYSNTTISTATGITEATEDQSDTLPYTPVKELIRAGLLLTDTVAVEDPTTSKTYYKTLHYSADKESGDVETAIQAITWPTGKGQGGKIDGFVTRTRVKGRMD